MSLEDIKARAAAATPGPWAWSELESGRHQLGQVEGNGVLRCASLLWPKQVDATFIAHAREDVPALVDALERVHELHRPIEATFLAGDEEFSATVCRTCFTEDVEIPEPYPCPTVTAIRTALADDRAAG